MITESFQLGPFRTALIKSSTCASPGQDVGVIRVLVVDSNRLHEGHAGSVPSFAAEMKSSSSFRCSVLASVHRVLREVNEGLVMVLVESAGIRSPGERIVPSARIPRQPTPFSEKPIADGRHRLVGDEGCGAAPFGCGRIDRVERVDDVPVGRERTIPRRAAIRS